VRNEIRKEARNEVSPDLLSLGSGAAIAAMGGLILLDNSGVIDVSLGWAAVALTAAVGVIVLLSGLADGGPSRHD
jgi:hypothetical protein